MNAPDTKDVDAVADDEKDEGWKTDLSDNA